MSSSHYSSKRRNVLILVLLLATSSIYEVVCQHGLGPCLPNKDGTKTIVHRLPIETRDPIVGEVKICENNTASSLYPCQNIDLLSFLPPKSLKEDGGANVEYLNDIWGWTHPDTGAEYAIVGMQGGFSFVDLSDPVNPSVLGYLPTHSSDSNWHDVKTHKNHAFIVSEADDHGLQVFDLMLLSNITSYTTLNETAHYNDHELGQAHNIFINEHSDTAYVVGADEDDCSEGGLHMVNVSDPKNPIHAGCYADDGYTHDVQCVIYDGPDTDYAGREICFASNEDDVAILDVTDKSSVTIVSKITYENAGYTHQGWLTEDKAYFLIDDEKDELYSFVRTKTVIADVSDLDNPKVIGTHTSRNRAVDHNQYIVGNYTYQANYESGLRVLDLGDVDEGVITEVAYFDIMPGRNFPLFNGAWSNYPFFKSGIVIVSGIEQGLFVLRVNFDFPDGPGAYDDFGHDVLATVVGVLKLITNYINYFLRILIFW